MEMVTSDEFLIDLSKIRIFKDGPQNLKLFSSNICGGQSNFYQPKSLASIRTNL